MAKRKIEYIYGLNPCFEVILAGRRNIKQAFIQENINTPRVQKLLKLLCEKAIPVKWVGKDRLFQLSSTKEHQGCVLKTGTYVYHPFKEMLDSERVLLLDNVEDPHNVGAMLRTAEIFGFNKILLPVKGVPGIYPSVVKVSAGATEHLFIAREMKSSTYVQKLKKAGFAIVSMDASGKTSIEDISSETKPPLALVIGGEAKSVSSFVMKNSDYTVAINQHGNINSLNASVAAAIAMYEIGGRRC